MAYARSCPSPRPEFLPDQLQPGGHVAPLVGAAHLQLDATGAVQVQEVRGCSSM